MRGSRIEDVSTLRGRFELGIKLLDEVSRARDLKGLDAGIARLQE